MGFVLDLQRDVLSDDTNEKTGFEIDVADDDLAPLRTHMHDTDDWAIDSCRHDHRSPARCPAPFPLVLPQVLFSAIFE